MGGGTATSTSKTVYKGLDPVGARIWKLIQSPRTVQEVCETLLEGFEVEAEHCEKDLIVILQEFAKNGLIDIVDNI